MRFAATAASLLLASLASGAAEGPSPDAAIRKRIDALRARAANLKADGKKGDWEGFPVFEDYDPPGALDPALDIRRVALAPLDDELHVLIETAGPPSRAPLAFGVDIDFRGRSGRDVSIQFGAGGYSKAVLFPEGEEAKPMRLEKPPAVGIEGVVEIRVPLDACSDGIGKQAGRDWKAGARRSFVRVQTFSFQKGIEGPIDAGPAPASFRLDAGPWPLDPPLRPDGEPRRAVAVPLDGRWFVRQGAHGLWSHADLWAYDLAVEDHALSPCAVPGSRRLADYYSYAKSVLAPEEGTVAFIATPVPDREPLGASTGKDTGNTLVVRLEDGFRLSLGHLQAESIAFARGEKFPRGEILARVGNSGDSGAPHLHVSLHGRPGEFVGLPLAFKDVRVGLNPGDDDPWARDLPSWAIREGWFVEAR